MLQSPCREHGQGYAGTRVTGRYGFCNAATVAVPQGVQLADRNFFGAGRAARSSLLRSPDPTM
eukprot:scaffold7599_cov417-Prasinococcus_capsulatus_cf.AAC.5